MACFDCGKSEKLYEFVDGRRIIHLCQMCKAEREWRRSPDNMKIPSPKKISLWQKIINYFRRGRR